MDGSFLRIAAHLRKLDIFRFLSARQFKIFCPGPRMTRATGVPPIMVGAADLGGNNFRAVITRDRTIVGRLAFPCGIIDLMETKDDAEFNKIVRSGVKAIKSIAATFNEHGLAPWQAGFFATAFRDLEKEGSPRTQRALTQFHDAARPYGIVTLSNDEEIDWLRHTAHRDLADDLTPGFRHLADAHEDVTLIHWGGSTLDLLFLRAGDSATLPLGVRRLDAIRQKNPSNPFAAQKALVDGLSSVWPQGNQDILALEGGQCRAIAKLLCNESDSVLSRQEVEAGMWHLAEQNESYYRKMHGQPKRRAAQMAFAAAQLLMLVEYMDAKQVVFLRGKMVRTIADELHDKIAIRPEISSASSPSGSIQLSAPSAPERLRLALV